MGLQVWLRTSNAQWFIDIRGSTPLPNPQRDATLCHIKNSQDNHKKLRTYQAFSHSSISPKFLYNDLLQNRLQQLINTTAFSRKSAFSIVQQQRKVVQQLPKTDFFKVSPLFLLISVQKCPFTARSFPYCVSQHPYSVSRHNKAVS